MGDLWLVPPEGAALALARDRIMIGRDAGADVVVPDPSVSRRHALIERTESGWLVSDQNSANGTWLDGQRIAKAPLRPGQRIRFGAVAFSVVDRAPAAPPPLPLVAASPEAPPTGTPTGAPAAPPASRTSPTMSAAQAAELLGVLPGAPAHEVRRRYAKIYNDFQVRLTNAPTPALKRLYQKHIQELREACEVLSPGLLDSE